MGDDQTIERAFEAFAALREDVMMRSRRQAAFNLMKKAPMPLFRHGLNVNADPTFDFSSLRPKPNPRISNVLKPGKAVVRLLGTLPVEWEDFLQSAGERNWLELLHKAFTNAVLIVDIGAEGEPIEITLDSDDILLLTTIVRVRKGIHAQLTIKKSSSSHYQSDDVRILLEDESALNLATVDGGVADAAIQMRAIELQRDSNLSWTDLSFGHTYIRSDNTARLRGVGSTSRMSMLFLGKGSDLIDISTVSLHEAPKTLSDMLTRGVLSGQARGVSRGLIRIGRDAAGSNGYERQDALLLSAKAEADALPNLEIDNNEVKCTHGATVGRLDAEKLFYVMSRGILEKDAKALLIEGYFSPALERIGSEKLREKMREVLVEALDDG